MARRVFTSLALLIVASGWAASRAEAQVSFKEGPDKIDVQIAGKPFTTLYLKSEWPKPFLHPLRTASGTVITRGFPLEKVEGESNDHIWHRGLWFAHGDINGVDFWRERSGDAARDAKLPLPVGKIVLRGRPKVAGGKNEGTISADFDFVAPAGKSIGTLRQSYTFRRVGQNNVVDLRAAVVADKGAALKMGDTEEGLLGFRFADEFRQDRGATLSNSEGLKGTDNIWGKRARWVDYSATVKGEAAGVVIFDHPQNPKHPTFWHARGYGLNAANPFGEHDFYNDKSRDGSVTIPAGKDLTFRYRIVIHPGTAESVGAEKLFAAFSKGT